MPLTVGTSNRNPDDKISKIKPQRISADLCYTSFHHDLPELLTLKYIPYIIGHIFNIPFQNRGQRWINLCVHILCYRTKLNMLFGVWEARSLGDWAGSERGSGLSPSSGAKTGFRMLPFCPGARQQTPKCSDCRCMLSLHAHVKLRVSCMLFITRFTLRYWLF